MEMLIYKTLKWKLHYPTPGEIARRLVHITSAISFEGMPHFLKKVDSFIDLCLFGNFFFSFLLVFFILRENSFLFSIFLELIFPIRKRII